LKMAMQTTGPTLDQRLRLLRDENTYLRSRNAELREVLCGSDPDLPTCLRPIEWLHTLLLDADKIHAALDGDDPSAVDMMLDELRTMVTKARALLEEGRETPPDLREDHAGSVVSVPWADQMSGEVRR
jgi:hypothetical protein